MFEMDINGEYLFYGISTLICIELAWDFYLGARQYKVLMSNSQIPTEFIGILPQEAFEKARLYAIDRSRFCLVNNVYTLMISMWIMFCNILPYYWRSAGNILEFFGLDYSEETQSSLFIAIINISNSITLLPLSIYNVFVVEQKHGFNQQTFRFFLRDKFKMHILTQVIMTPIVWVIIFIIKNGGDYFFVYAWFFVMLTTLFMYSIYPEYIAPLFDKYNPLPESDLKNEIEKLASSAGFPLYGLYVLQNSKRSTHSNAFIFGAFNSKRIVIFETLIKQYLKAEEQAKLRQDERPEDEKDEEIPEENEEEKGTGEQAKPGCDLNEILAIMAHELGHWKYNHITKKMVLMQLNVFMVLAFFSVLIPHKSIYHPFGFPDGAPLIVSLIVLIHFICLPYFGILSFFSAALSRYFEFQADLYSKSLGRGHHLKRALIKLNVDNLGFPIYDPWYSAWYNSHPVLLERIRALDKDD